MSQRENQPPSESAAELSALNLIRTATVLTRYPVHRLTKQGEVQIALKTTDEGGQLTLQWRVSHNSDFGQPGPLAYKIDTLIINRKIQEAGYPVPPVLNLGSLNEIASELGLGGDKESVKKALHQNASAYITAKLTYKTKQKGQAPFEFGHSRYGVVFTGEQLPDGTKADAVYIVFQPLYQALLNRAETRPLDYDYLRALKQPAAQRLYELLSRQIWGAIESKRPRAKYLYSEFCKEAPQTRYAQYWRMHRQMNDLHAPHFQSGYIVAVEFRETTDQDGKPDWEILYTPGPKAKVEHQATTPGSKKPKREPRPKQQALPFFAPEPKPEPTTAEHDPETSALVAELVSSELNQATAVIFAKGDPDECRRQLAFTAAMTDEDFTEGRGAYLARAIPEKWGPPKRYKERQRQEEAARTKAEAAQAANARQSHGETRRATEEAQARKTLSHLENEQGEAYSAFTEWLRAKRVRFENICRNLSEERKLERLRDFDSEANRVRLFQEWQATKK